MTTTVAPDAQLLTIREAAEVLRLSPSQVERYLTAGVLRRIKLGVRTLLRREDIDRAAVDGLPPLPRKKVTTKCA